METFLTTLHVLSCISLIVVVLLQRGKGADMGAMLGGGGSQTVFGARGAGNFLTKLTTGCAVVFMVTSLSLAYLSGRASESLIFDGSQPAIEEGADTLGESGETAAGSSAGTLEEVGGAAVGALEEVGDAAADSTGGATEAAASAAPNPASAGAAEAPGQTDQP